MHRIFNRTKKVEFRTVATKKRGTVYIYASLNKARKDECKRNEPFEKLPRGVLVGTVEVVDCVKYGHRDYGYILKNPRRFKKPLKARKKAQPVWFIPF
ncbi:hypothetical protein EBT16_13705 [bacterium]|nr:hypothetical protein [bacterium]